MYVCHISPSKNLLYSNKRGTFERHETNVFLRAVLNFRAERHVNSQQERFAGRSCCTRRERASREHRTATVRLPDESTPHPHHSNLKMQFLV
jgi:hypothetical protein